MGKKDILVIVKTYPEISRKYTETVCTAGILADTNSLVRLYPIRFRYLEGDKQFRKYQWIRADISKTPSDPRPESYNILPDSIETGDIIPTGKGWDERWAWCLNKNTLFPSIEALRSAQELDGISLGIVKPKTIKRVIIQTREETEIEYAMAKKDSVINQLDLFEEKKDLYILPIRILMEFDCEGPHCTGHKMSILDWELGQLYRKVAGSHGWEDKIQGKIMGEICAEDRDTYFILGNMVAHPQTFCLLGFFWPPKTVCTTKAPFRLNRHDVECLQTVAVQFLNFLGDDFPVAFFRVTFKTQQGQLASISDNGQEFSETFGFIGDAFPVFAKKSMVVPGAIQFIP